MCKALDDLWKEGVETGMAQGISQGISKGISQGRQQGIEEKTRIIVTNLLKRGMADADICALAECSIEFLEEVKKINKNDTM